MADNVEWVIGASGRPIKKGGKAHKRLLKKQALEEAAALPATAVGGSGRVKVTDVGAPVSMVTDVDADDNDDAPEMLVPPSLKEKKGPRKPAVKKRKLVAKPAKRIYEQAELPAEFDKVEMNGDTHMDEEKTDIPHDDNEPQPAEKPKAKPKKVKPPKAKKVKLPKPKKLKRAESTPAMAEESDDDDDDDENEPTTNEVTVIVEGFIKENSGELQRAYEALGEGEEFVSYLNALMEAKLTV